MHENSYSKMKWFKNSFLSNKDNLKILDVGPLDLQGNNYKSIFSEPNWEYDGLDVKNSNNVDIIVKDIYDWGEIPDNSYDVVVSGQLFNNFKFYWKIMSEIKRVLKPSGYVCIIVQNQRYKSNAANNFKIDDFDNLAKYLDFDVIYLDESEENELCFIALNKNHKMINFEKELNSLEQDQKVWFNFKKGIENLNSNVKNVDYNSVNENENLKNEDYNDLLNENEKLKLEIGKIRNELNSFKKTTNGILDSYNYLFNTIFLDFELNKPTAILNNIQLLCTELLAFVGNICKKNDITWWLEAGNALGAARHGYFVPWDDDVDIAMLRKDYMEFDKILNDEIRHYKLEDIIKTQYKARAIDNTTVGGFIQIFLTDSLKGHRPQILAGVDVFPFDYLKDYKDMDSFNDLYYESKLTFYRNISKNHDMDYCIDKLYDDLNLSFDKQKYLVPGVEGAFGKRNVYKLVVLETDKIFPLKEAKFGDRVFPCVKDLHHQLKLYYGDYLSIPKNIHRHSRVESVRYRMDERVFKKNLQRLKDINSTFKDSF